MPAYVLSQFSTNRSQQSWNSPYSHILIKQVTCNIWSLLLKIIFQNTQTLQLNSNRNYLQIN